MFDMIRDIALALCRQEANKNLEVLKKNEPKESEFELSV
jgi:hypothetical protein